MVDAPRCLRERGFAFAPSFGEVFARQYIQLMGEDVAKRKKQRIAGDVEQFAMPETGSSPWPTQLKVQWHALVAKLAQHVGVDPEQLQVLLGVKVAEVHSAKPQLHVQDVKLLIAGRQKGEQAPLDSIAQQHARVRQATAERHTGGLLSRVHVCCICCAALFCV